MFICIGKRTAHTTHLLYLRTHYSSSIKRNEAEQDLSTVVRLESHGEWKYMSGFKRSLQTLCQLHPALAHYESETIARCLLVLHRSKTWYKLIAVGHTDFQMPLTLTACLAVLKVAVLQLHSMSHVRTEYDPSGPTRSVWSGAVAKYEIYI